MASDDTHAELLREALSAIRRQKAQIQALQTAAHEAVAVVGIGCMLPPGLRGPAAFWAARRARAPAAAPMPARRDWFGRLESAALHPPDVPVGRAGVFFDAVLGFDPPAFGIPAREAESMDPQHRALLETAWHALEDAQVAPDRLARSATGVFVGLMNHDWGHLACAGLSDIRVHTAAGNGLGVAAGRIAHAFGFTGPALALDSNCASSLVAVHLAAASLRQRECDLALAAGANLVLSPAMNVVMAKAGALSPSDRCRSFDARADGYARGEGCGAVVLKRLSDALAAGDRIYALVRGGAVNHGGRTSALSVPSAPAQEAVMRRALEAAALAPGDVDYLETHGTGTPLGDPIELEAIQRVYGAGRAAPLHLGSVKNTLGHQEGAAGIVSFIRAALALHGEEIPPFGADGFVPTPHFDWSASPLAVAPAAGAPWPRAARVRRAAVSAFGFSGTNCHVVLEEAPATPPLQPSQPAPRGQLRLCLSAASRASLQALAESHAQQLAGCGMAEARALCGATHRGRAALPWRAAFRADTVQELVARLRAPLQPVQRGGAPEQDGRVCVRLGEDADWYVRFARQLARGEDPAAEPPQARPLPLLQADALRGCMALGFCVEAVHAEGPAQIGAAVAAGVLGEQEGLALHGLLRDASAAANAARIADLLRTARPGAAAFDLLDAAGPLPWAQWCEADHWLEPRARAGGEGPREALPVLALGVAPDDAGANVADPLDAMAEAMVQLFLRGGAPRWERLPRLPLPAALFVAPYPFERKPFFVAGTACDPRHQRAATPAQAAPTPPPAPAARGKPTADAVLAFIRAALAELAGDAQAPADADTTWAEAGIDSLMALEVRSRIAGAYGVQLAPQLLQTATLRACAQAVAAQAGGTEDARLDGHARLVPVRKAAQPIRTLVLVHPVGGTVQAYGALARRLDAHTGVLAIGNTPLPAGAAPPSVARMAAAYVELVDGANPPGTLLLGGWSMGGLIALEMAALLRARGRPVERVLLLDSIVMEATPQALAADPDAVALSVFAMELGLGAQDVQDAQRQVAIGGDALQLLHARAVARGLLGQAVSADDLAWHLRLLRQNFEALVAFRPAVYDEAVDYFQASEPLAGVLAASRHLSARELRGPVRRWRVPGSHFTLVHEPQVATLAQLLREALPAPAAPQTA